MNPKRILLCDDEAHILRAAEFKFKRSGYEVYCASDGEEGWRLAQEVRPDIVITDCQMPRLDGLSLAARIKNDPELSGLPVIMLTGKGFELNHATVCEKYGVVTILAKPFSPRDLFQRVEVVLHAHAMEPVRVANPKTSDVCSGRGRVVSHWQASEVLR